MIMIICAHDLSHGWFYEGADMGFGMNDRSSLIA